MAVPIAALAFLATWLIPQVELKRWPEAGAASPDEEMAVASVTVAPEAQAQEVPAQEAPARVALATGARQAVSPPSRADDPARRA